MGAERDEDAREQKPNRKCLKNFQRDLEKRSREAAEVSESSRSTFASHHTASSVNSYVPRAS